MTLSRRRIVTGLGAMAAPSARPVTPEPSATGGADRAAGLPAGRPPSQLARDERFWATVARQFQVSPDFVNLENGYYGIMPEPVRHAYHRNVDHLNEGNSHLLRTTYKQQADQVSDRIADPARRLRGGDRADPRRHRGPAEPDRRLSAAATGRRGDVRRPRLPQRAVRHELAAGRRGVRSSGSSSPSRRPARRCSTPTREPCADRSEGEAAPAQPHEQPHRPGHPGAPDRRDGPAHGVDVIVDAAHSWGQLDFTMPDLGRRLRRLLPAQVDGRAAGSRIPLHPQGPPGRHRPRLRR